MALISKFLPLPSPQFFSFVSVRKGVKSEKKIQLLFSISILPLIFQYKKRKKKIRIN